MGLFWNGSIRNVEVFWKVRWMMRFVGLLRFVWWLGFMFVEKLSFRCFINLEIGIDV